MLTITWEYVLITKTYQFPVKCWKCGSDITAIYEAVWNGISLIDANISVYCLKFDNVKRLTNFSRIDPGAVVNVCPECGAHQGNWYIKKLFYSAICDGENYEIDSRYSTSPRQVIRQ
jgi:hypothetical protein